MSVLPKTGFERALWPVVITVVGVVALSVAVVFLWISKNSGTARVARRNCGQIEQLKTAYRADKRASDRLLMERTDLPPSVKAQAHANNLASLERFAPVSCKTGKPTKGTS